MHAHAPRVRTMGVIVAMTAAMVLVPTPASATDYPCDLAGLDQAIADSGGPHTFNCGGPTTIATPGDYFVLDRVVELDGQGLLTIEVQPDPVSRAFLVAGVSELILHNLAITGGDVGLDAGGAIFAGGDSQVHLHNVDLYDNGAGEGGAIALNEGAFVRLFESRLVDNRAGDGGAIALRGSDALIQGSSLLNNVANGDSGGRLGKGGALWAIEGRQTSRPSSVRFEGSNVGSNIATFHGGGIYVSTGATLDLFQTSVTYNSSLKSGGGVYGGNLSAINVTESNISGNLSRNGGGIYAWDSALVVDVSSVTDNHALIWDGGGVQLVTESQPSVGTFVESYIGLNTAARHGGGVVLTGAQALFQGVHIDQNDAAFEGGGLWVRPSTTAIVLEGSTVSSNTSGNVGGGFYIRAASVDVISTAVVDNMSGDGGGFYVADASVNIRESHVAGNQGLSGEGGAVLAIEGSFVGIEDSEIVENAAEDGGAVWADHSSVEVLRSVVAGNTATDEVGGIANLFGTLLINESALIGNTGVRFAGAVYNGSGGIYTATAQVTNSCIVDNSDPAVLSNRTGFNALNNWWGDPSGPSGEGPGTGDSIAGGWVFDPWATDILGPCIFAEAPWAPGEPPSGACEVLVWFDQATILLDTDEAQDEWRVMAAASFYDFDDTRDRTIASIGIVDFVGDAGDTIVLERQWRTEMWDSFANLIRLDHLGFTVYEDDGRSGDDRGTTGGSPGWLIECGETMSFSILLPVAPSTGRSRVVTDTFGLIQLDMTITAVPARWAPPRPR